MPGFTIYNGKSGAIAGTVFAGDEKEAAANLAAGQKLLEGIFSHRTYSVKDGKAVADTSGAALPPERLARQTRDLCGAIITAVAPITAQTNVQALLLSGKCTDADRAGAEALRDWIAACRATCRELVAAEDADLAAQRAKYPPPPQALLEFLKGV